MTERRLPNDYAKCLGTRCGDRERCARWEEHYPKTNPYQVFAAFDSNRGEHCEFLIDLDQADNRSDE